MGNIGEENFRFNRDGLIFSFFFADINDVFGICVPLITLKTLAGPGNLPVSVGDRATGSSVARA